MSTSQTKKLLMIKMIKTVIIKIMMRRRRRRVERRRKRCTQLMVIGLFFLTKALWGSEGGPWGDGWVMHHPRTSTG